ncbi:hypothetical protein EYZ11_010990 [Aspergillus tanneri]|uniref:Uncharacterized protein n=1 Tax=Aspergillus tanneri TaxID=1220188 RepID=A0A4S3J3X7_9EURO|nr:uncharacterized protein ATNIH1004_005155 [Aspergillus tanneri]KAA8649259.1 hypothetical protein ATNIH1004_005155 [Aspergillus tanneri]THC89566.1 hypothetical protein EYZ11_010990 [Aspergillus tanneri]
MSPSKTNPRVQQTTNEIGFPNGNVHFEAFSVASTGDPFVAELAESLRRSSTLEARRVLDALRMPDFISLPAKQEIVGRVA